MNQHMPMGSPPMQMDPATMAAMAAMDVGGGGGGGPLAGAAPMAVPMAGGAGGGGIGGLPMPSPPVGGSSLGTVAGRVGYGAASYGSLGTQPSAEMMDVADADGGAGDQAAAAAAAAAPAAAAGGWVAPQYNWDEAPQSTCARAIRVSADSVDRVEPPAAELYSLARRRRAIWPALGSLHLPLSRGPSISVPPAPASTSQHGRGLSGPGAPCTGRTTSAG